MPKYHNPCYDEESMHLKHPMYRLICGITGSGKTNVIMNMIRLMEHIFNFIKIFTQNKHEPQFQCLESIIDKPQLEVFEGLDELNAMDFDKAQYLFIFDDCCLELDQSAIEQLYIRGRKLAEGSGVSSVYLSQSYFSTPKLIRKQINYVILKKINDKRDVDFILRECSINADRTQMTSVFTHCVRSRTDITTFMLIDFVASDEQTIRKNFDEILNFEMISSILNLHII